MSPPWVKSKDPKSKQRQQDKQLQLKQQNLNFQSKSHEIQKKSQDKIQDYQQKRLQQNIRFDTIYDNQNSDKKQEQNNEINLDFDEPKKKEEQIQQKQKFNFLNRPSEKQQQLNSIKSDNEQQLQQQKIIQNLQPQKFCESPDIADVLEIINNQDNKKQEQSQDINEKKKYTQQSSDSQEYNQAQYIDCYQEEFQNENQKISQESNMEQKNQKNEQFLEQIKQKNKQDLNYYEIMQLGVDLEQSSEINNEISQNKNQEEEEQQYQQNQYELQENNLNLEENKNQKKVVNFQNSELNSEQEEDSIFMSEEEDNQESGEEKKIQENSVKQIYQKKIEQKQRVQKNKLCDASQSQKQHFNDVILKDQNLIKKIKELLQKCGDFDPNFEVINSDSDKDENQKNKENNKEQEQKGKKSKKLPYKIIDDLKLIIGVKELPNKMQNFQGYGPHFYKTLMQKKYASKGRSPDSLRDRHLKYLSVLNENDIYKILDFVKENGINGYINFFNDLDQQTRKYLNCTKGHITKLDKKNIETYEKFAVKEDSIDQSEILQILEEEQNQDSQSQDQKFSNFQNQEKNTAQNKNNYTQQQDSNKIYTVSKSGDKTVMVLEQVDKYDNKQVQQQEKISVQKLSLLEKQQLYKNKIQNDIQELSKNKQENVKKIDISEIINKQSSNKKRNQIQDDENYSSEIVEIQDDENDIDNENDNLEQHFGQIYKEQQFLKQISSTKKSIISKKTSPYSNQEETKIDEIQISDQYQNQQKVQNQQKQFQLVENQLMDPNLIDPQLSYSFKKISKITNSNIKNRNSSINQQNEQIEESENNEISAKKQTFPSLQKQQLNQNKYKGDQQYFQQYQQQQNQQFSGSSNKQNKKRKQNEFDYQQNFGDFADSPSPDFYLQENSSDQNLVYENLNQYFKNSSQKQYQQQQQKSTSIYEQQQSQQNNCQCDIYKEIDQDFGLNQVQKQQYKKNKVFKSIYDKQLRNSALNSIDMTKIWVQKKLVLMDTQQEQQIVKWTQNLLKNTQPQIYQSQQNNFNSGVINVISKNFKGFELNRQCENVKIANIDGLNYFIETHIKKQEDLDQEQMEEFIQDLMEKYGLQQNQFYKVFESVSYNPEDLALVMEKNMQNLQWDEEDDEILKNAENQNDRSFKLLLRYKGKERIQRRIQFKNFDLKFDVMKD
ncbi:hypothetical protein PPERSA_09891 [Pseudocohnilembus persalinus]|uniref:TRF2-interacting telomeric protein/Rap1 C-terminal domain-containing protein n=1 Tax=Pseudocohnilembus persalinus TaxID=266149 RepID=A0A0V0QU80_PSEPJ|nr:hypothetical protein PPERSA_09891 [Pseudocohnilembus persalinus]|eukprot:KRX05751.1 hypothetical protein PPERSA_09891 [Pseudocohnilembus persalinus]